MLRLSSIYETAPRDREDQPWFLNVVAEVETDLFPRQLLSHVQRVEFALGRRRTVPKGPRTIDIDVLLYGQTIVRLPTLTVPHPALHERRFVLEPLVELAPDLRHPALRRSLRDLLAALPPQALRRTTLDLNG